MCVGTDIRVYAETYTRSLAFGSSEGVDDVQLFERFHIETENTGIKAEVYFPVGFAYSCIDYLLWGEPGIECTLYLTAADSIDTEPRLLDNAEYVDVGICLDGIVQVIVVVPCQFAFYGFKGFFEYLLVIVVERCFDTLNFI